MLISKFFVSNIYVLRMVDRVEDRRGIVEKRLAQLGCKMHGTLDGRKGGGCLKISLLQYADADADCKRGNLETRG